MSLVALPLSLAILHFVPRDEAGERRRDHAIGLTGGVL